MTHSLQRQLPLFLATLFVIAGVIAQAQESQSSSAAGETAADIELPLLLPSLENLWDGSWHREVAARLNEENRPGMGELIGEAIRKHRDAFSAQEPGARETQLLDIEWTLAQRGEAIHNPDGLTGRLAKRIVPLYRRLHQSLMDEKFNASRSIDAIEVDPLGENLLSGELLIDVISYVVQTEKMTGTGAIERSKALTSAKVDQFARWVRQRREPDRVAVSLTWSDWKDTEAAYYSQPELEDAALNAVYTPLRNWYFDEYLVATATRIDEAVQATDSFEANGLDPELIAIIELLVDRPRYEEAFITWLSENEKSLATLGIIPEPDEHVHAALGVDKVSGKPLSNSDTGKTAFLKTILYKKFQDTLAELLRQKNNAAESKIESLSAEQRKLLKSMSYLY